MTNPTAGTIFTANGDGTSSFLTIGFNSLTAGSSAQILLTNTATLSGTFSVTNGSANVTASTSQNNVLMPGSSITFSGGTGPASGTFTILSVTGTAIVLTANYTNTTSTGSTGTSLLPTWTTVSGDLTIGATGTTTLATVNSNTGSFGSGTQVPVFTVNAKGLITAVTNTTITGISPSGAAGGDLSGTYPNPTVAKINISSVPAGGSLTTGNVLQVNGSSSLTYAAVNLAGGANYVTGNLPISNVAPGTSAQVLMSNATPATTWTTLSQDATISATGAVTVGQLQGSIVLSGTPSAGQVLTATSTTAAHWATSSGFTAGSDLSGNSTSTSTNQYVSSLSYSSAAGGGTIAINGTGTILQFANNNTAPALNVAAPAATNTPTNGFALTFTGQAGTAGLSGSNNGGSGGAVTIASGLAGVPSGSGFYGVGGLLTLQTQNQTSTNNTTGGVTVSTGNAGSNGASGAVNMTTGSGFNSGSILIESGTMANSGNSGGVTIETGSTSGTTGTSGGILLQSGTNGGSNPTGSITLQVGNQSGSARCGNIVLETGTAAGLGGGSQSGSIQLITSSNAGSGSYGAIILESGGGTGGELQIGPTDGSNTISGFLFNNGSFFLQQIATKTANYTLTQSGNYIVLVDTTTAATGTTMTLPSSPTTGVIYVIKDSTGSAATFNITISGNGKNIDGSSTQVLSANYASVELIYNGTQWNIIGGYNLKGNVTIIAANTSTYSVLTTDYIISVSANTTTGITITLPSAPNKGDTYVVKDSGGTAFTWNITIDSGSGNIIDGSRTYVVATNYAALTLIWINSTTKWSVI